MEYLDTNIKLIHVGHKAYTGDVAEWLKNWKIKLENGKTEIQPEDKLAKYFDKDVDEDDDFKVL